MAFLHKIENKAKLHSKDTLKEKLSRCSKLNETENQQSVSFYELFRFVDSVDVCLLSLMAVSSIVLGLVFPINIILFRLIVKIVNDYTPEMNIFDAFKPVVMYYFVLSLCVFVAGFVQMTSIYSTTKRQTTKLQICLYQSILRQDIAWFSLQAPGRLITIMTDNVESFQLGIGSKLSNFIIYLSSAIGCFAIALINGFKLTMYGISVAPCLGISFVTMAYYLKLYTIKENEAYSIAGSVAEEILSSIKTVFAFNSQDRERDRYVRHLKVAEGMGIKKSFVQGIGIGLSNFTVFAVAAVVFYNGFHLMVSENLDPSIIIQVFSAMVIGSAAMGFAVPILENFTAATVAAFKIYEITDRISPIDINKKGQIAQPFCGKIDFQNVSFEYPTRPGFTVLKNFSFVIQPGQTVALVGPSGSGKTSIIGLLQRFYDPVKGEIIVDGIKLKDVDVQWYRSNISVVQQEPPLFSGTISENIRMGKLDAEFNDIEAASKEANAYDFIVGTKEKFETNLTEKGGNFSGGQKQRIAIASALIRRPKLLLLDEATSALDNTSEKIVQQTLENATKSHSMTVVIVAHRLSTVRFADRIVVLKEGEIIEDGKHDDLMTLKGWYWEMIRRQNADTTKSELSFEQNSLTHAYESSNVSSSISLESTFAVPPLGRMSRSKSFLVKMSTDREMKLFYRILNLNEPEKKYMYIGVIAAVVAGLGYPVAAFVYSQMFKIFALRGNPELMLRLGTRNSFMMLIPAFLLLFGQFLKNAMFGISGEILTTRLRSLAFKSLISQDMDWLDRPDNSPGILTSRLSVEASLVKALAGIRIGILIEGLTTVVSALIIAFLFSWKLTLTMIVFIPMIIFAGIYQGRHSSGNSVRYSNPINANAVVLESINNIKTVTALGLQDHFLNIFSKNLISSENRSEFWNYLKFGIVSGVAASALYFSYAVVFLVGGWLIQRRELEVMSMMRVFSTITMSMSALGRTLTLAPDASSAQEAAKSILGTISRKSKVKMNDGKIPNKKHNFGKIEFRNVVFKYASRPGTAILQGISFTVEPRQTVAFVGPSGGGKSTIFQLIERFYDLSEYENENSPIKLHNVDIKQLNLTWLRDNIGIVSQEPTLFNLTIKENIMYSSRSQNLGIADVVEAAKMANIHEFIESLPKTYDTMVGQRGTFLSGGQKQRICIARALIGKPLILIFDEATSALDAESETQVQEAIDQVQKDMTCLIIAHRLSTIRNVDRIFVIDKGVVVESGTHDELMNLNGHYKALYATHSEII